MNGCKVTIFIKHTIEDTFCHIKIKREKIKTQQNKNFIHKRKFISFSPELP